MICLKFQTLTTVSGLSVLFFLILHSSLVLNYNTECLKNYYIVTTLQIDEHLIQIALLMVDVND
jgi:hypothetical protein